MRNLREFLAALRDDGDLLEIDAEADPRFEIPEIHRRVIARGGPALLFRHPKGSRFPVVTNLFGTLRRVERAFGKRPLDFVKLAASAATELVPPTPGKLWRFRSLLTNGLRVGLKTQSSAPVTEIADDSFDLTALPALTQWPLDGGPFLTLPLVYTEHPAKHEHNLGMYRIQIHSARQTGIHWQIGKGGGFHYHEAERGNQSLPVTIFLGGPPALILAAIAPLPEGLPELLLASLLLGERMGVTRVPSHPHRLVSECEFALTGEVPKAVRKAEGPFGDHYGYYSLAHDYPVFEMKRVYHRHDAIFPATVVGKPRQEDYFIGDFLQELLSPLFPLVMPSVVELLTYGDTGFHSLTAAIVKDRYPREAMVSAFRILGEGQLSFTKVLLVMDEKRDLRDFRGVLTHILERCRFETDLFILANVSMDTLDYTGPAVNEGSKCVFLGLGAPVRDLPREWRGELPAGIGDVAVYCPGALVVSGPSFEGDPKFASRIAQDPLLREWPLVVLSDEPRAAARDDGSFLWYVFTRFEPAADIHAARTAIRRNHLAYEGPLVVDARMKPWMPAVVEADPETVELVNRRAPEYSVQFDLSA